MKVIIIEDEKPSARRLQRMLDKIGIQVEIMLHSVEESVSWFQKNEHPDLIFLDIQLSDGLSFEIFDLVNVKSAIIFTTAYDAYALQAFKLNSVDYLLKPIDVDEMEHAVMKFNSNQAAKQPITLNFDDIKRLLLNPNEKEKNEYKTRFSIKVGSYLKLISVDQIECVYSENKGSYLHTKEGRNYLIDLTLEQLEFQLDPKVFFRVNRTFLVNIHAIKDMISYTNSRLQIKMNSYQEQDIIVARERVKDFKNWLE